MLYCSSALGILQAHGSRGTSFIAYIDYQTFQISSGSTTTRKHRHCSSGYIDGTKFFLTTFIGTACIDAPDRTLISHIDCHSAADLSISFTTTGDIPGRSRSIYGNLHISINILPIGRSHQEITASAGHMNIYASAFGRIIT